MGTQREAKPVGTGTKQEPGHPQPGATSTSPFRSLDHAKQALIARATGGFSPAALTLAFADWFIHVQAAPGKRLELMTLAADNTRRLLESLADAQAGKPLQPPAPALPEDDRYSADVWQIEPFQLWQRAFLLTEQWWRAATREVPGTTRHHEDVVSFVARQWLDLFAPANFVPTNPEVLQCTAATCGLNLAQGARNAIEDAWRVDLQKPPAGVER